MSGDPLEEGSKSNEIIGAIRKRKGLKVEVPGVEHYVDKL
jgi:elongation factor 2